MLNNESGDPEPNAPNLRLWVRLLRELDLREALRFLPKERFDLRDDLRDLRDLRDPLRFLPKERLWLRLLRECDLRDLREALRFLPNERLWLRFLRECDLRDDFRDDLRFLPNRDVRLIYY
jgi:hypothetical protein